MACLINDLRFIPAVLSAAALLALGACDEPSGPRAYDAPVEERPARLAEREAAGPNTPPNASQPASPAASAQDLQWTLPEGWAQQPGDSPMRHATLYSGDPAAADTLSVTVSRFSGNIGGLAANVNRWRRQVGLDPVDPEQVMQDVQPIEDSEVPCLMIDLTGEGGSGAMPGMPAPPRDAQGPTRLIVAWFSDGTHHWFFKATASPDVMEQHAKAFAQLIASVRPASGNDDGAPPSNPAATPNERPAPPPGAGTGDA